MNKRIHMLFLVCVLGLLLPTAVSHTLLAASQPAPVELVSIVDIEGPFTAMAGTVYTYTATASPNVPPITYVWQVDGQTITHTNGGVDTLAVSWTGVGQQPITVTASNSGGAATAVHLASILPPARHPDGYTDVYAAPRPGRAIVSSANGSIFGPYSCTDYGDPFSPFNNPYIPGPHAYRYRIQIPASYPYDVVRVELFDPDSMNRANPASPLTIYRTQAAIDAGLSPTTTGTCTNNQKDQCFIPTGELNLFDSGILDLEEINPYWFWRLDENRGAGTPPGNGMCGQPGTYNPLFNTDIHFALYYLQANGGDTMRVDLAVYTGQTGDGVRDNGDHDTDQRWVSPGAAQSYDQPIFVPADAGSPGNFEIDLTAETPGIIVDPVTGDRIIYLDVTALSGASENDFELWAGPPVYTTTAPSDANLRNVYLLDNPIAQDSYGVTIYALDYRPLNYNHARVTDVPLAYFPPSLAASLITVSMFDSDAGSQPPITFYFDTIAEGEWMMVFGQAGIPDPDGQVRNCVPGSCNNSWVRPPYQLALPANFPGGRLMARYRTGFGDQSAWEVKLHPEPTSLSLSGPVTGTSGVAYDFQAVTFNPTIVEPLTYTWQATNLPTQVQTGYLVDTASFSWPTGGVKTITVSAQNRYGVITSTHTVVISSPVIIPPTGLMINGPAVGLLGQPVTLTAVATPPTTTVPILYTWQTNEHLPLVHTSGITDTAVFTWLSDGSHTITLTAENGSDPLQTVFQLEIEAPDLTIIGPPQLVTPLPVGAGLPVSFTVIISNAGDAGVDTQFFVDVYINPTTVLSTGIPLTQSSGFTSVPALAAGESLTVTINAPFGFADQPLTHTVYAMIDSTVSVAESVETNNVSTPLTVTDVHPLLDGVTIFGPPLGLTGETYTFTAVVAPPTITDPITYTWLVESSPVLTVTNGTAVPISLTFPVTGSFDLLVIASHGFNTVTDTHTIVITDTPITDLAVIGAPHLLTPGRIRPDQPVSFTVTIQNVGNTPITSLFHVDLFIDPTVVLSTSIPITDSVGYVVVGGLNVGETAVLTFSFPAGLGPGPLVRQVYAMVDSIQAIPEADETNNVSPPLEVVVGWPLYLPVMLRP